MPDYQAMYAVLFRKITAVLEQLGEVQQETGEMYMSAQQSEIRVIDFGKRQSGGKETAMEKTESSGAQKTPFIRPMAVEDLLCYNAIETSQPRKGPFKRRA